MREYTRVAEKVGNKHHNELKKYPRLLYATYLPPYAILLMVKIIYLMLLDKMKLSLFVFHSCRMLSLPSLFQAHLISYTQTLNSYLQLATNLPIYNTNKQTCMVGSGPL